MARTSLSTDTQFGRYCQGCGEVACARSRCDSARAGWRGPGSVRHARRAREQGESESVCVVTLFSLYMLTFGARHISHRPTLPLHLPTGLAQQVVQHASFWHDEDFFALQSDETTLSLSTNTDACNDASGFYSSNSAA